MDTIDRFVDNIMSDDTDAVNDGSNTAYDANDGAGKELAIIKRDIVISGENPDDEPSDDNPDDESAREVFTAYCAYCGQARHIQKSWEVKTQADADDFATRECRCSRSKEYREEKSKAERRKENIGRINTSIDDELTAYALAHDAELTAPIRELIYNGAVAVLDEIITEHTIAFGSKIKVKAAMNSKDNIVLTYSYSDSEKHEV
jgi:hypothetical protein